MRSSRSSARLSGRTHREIPGTAGPPHGRRETGRRPPSAGCDPTRHRTLRTPTTRRRRAAVAAALLALVTSSTPVSGALAAEAFPTTFDTTFVVAAPLPAVPVEPRSLDRADKAAPTVTDLARAARPAPAGVARTRRAAVVEAASRPARLWAQLRRGLTVRGVASWYGSSHGYAGIAHVAMPGARFLAVGRTAPRARVCAEGRCTVVRVVDWCGCHVGTGRARVVDLSAMTVQRLGLDTARGVYRVTVTLLAS